ncbi:MAG: hypothetical protein K2N44_06310 [Lachnospiraceae bacterium]|nr:hypothetical protein [Lachnospiraceae bacterium]
MRQYSVKDLNVGMRVRREQLKDIYGVWIYFDNYISGEGGKIICISTVRDSAEVKEAVRNNGNIISMFYQDPDLCNDGVVIYD